MAPRGPLDDDARFAILRKLYDELKQQYGLSSSDIIEELEKRDTLIPITAFRRELSPLETVVKYLKENKQHTLTQIADSTQRSTKTIWQAYKGAQKKYTPPTDSLGHTALHPFEHPLSEEVEHSRVDRHVPA